MVSPLTAPTSPLAFARRSDSTSIVTHVASASPRNITNSAPIRLIPVKSQNQGRRRSVRASSGVRMNTAPARTNSTAVPTADHTITTCLRYRSIRLPNGTPRTAMPSM